MRLNSPCWLLRIVVLLFTTAVPYVVAAQSSDSVTFHRDIEPILQRSCQSCHREGGVAPMPLVTYEEVAPFAGLIEYKTGLRDKAGVMPPWYIEKNIGIKDYKDDISLTDDEISKLSVWARSGTPRGNPADAPEPLVFDDSIKWRAGEPDLVVKSNTIFVGGSSSDQWYEAEDPVKFELPEGRYVKSVEVVEVNDLAADATTNTKVGGRYVIHHMTWGVAGSDENGDYDPTTYQVYPVHELGRYPDIFDPKAGRPMPANPWFYANSIHTHSNGIDTNAHLEIGFIFHPVGYQPEMRSNITLWGSGHEISLPGNTADKQLHHYQILDSHTKIVTYEPHLHAQGVRMCMEAIWGYIKETLACAGYDHNWVRGYTFADNAAPLLPKGTILHYIAYMNTTDSNPNMADPRNWTGAGNRSVSNMFIELGQKVQLTEAQFLEAMEERREVLNLGPNDYTVGCPLCTVPLSVQVAASP